MDIYFISNEPHTWRELGMTQMDGLAQYSTWSYS